MREIAVFGGTAPPAPAAKIGADLGVRCAASQASSAAAWPCYPVAASNSTNPSTMSPRMNSARAAKTWKTSAAQGGGVFADKQSGKTASRPELAGCLDYLRVGDTLVVPSLDRLSRSLQDLIAFVAGLRRRGTGFRSVHEALADAAGLGQGAGLPVQVLPGRGHAGVPGQRASQVRRLGGERVVLIGDGESADRGQHHPATGRKTAVPQLSDTPASRTPFRHSPPAEN